MSKKLFSLSLLFGAFMFLASSASAQLNFFNGSTCFISVQATAEQNATPCLGPTCAAAPVIIGPGGFATITAPCVTTVLGLGYRSVKVTVFGGSMGGADKCTGPNPNIFRDCTGTPRTLFIASPNFASYI